MFITAGKHQPHIGNQRGRDDRLIFVPIDNARRPVSPM
jgi:hypothetical protein